MDENQAIQEINEEVTDTALEMTNSSNNVLIKVAFGGIIAIGAAVGAMLLYKKLKRKKETVVEVKSEAISETEVENNENIVEE